MEQKPTTNSPWTIDTNFRLLFDNMLNGFAYHQIITDKAGHPIDYTFIEVNKAFQKFTGLKRDDIIGRRVTEIIPGVEESDFDWIGTYGQVALSGNPIEFEQYFEPLRRWYRIAAFCPQKGYFAVTFEDVSDRKLAEKKARDSQGIFQSFLENSPVYIFFKDPQIRSLMLSKNYEKMLGMPLQQILGKTMDELFPSDLAKAMVEDDKRILREGKIITVVEEFAGRIYETTKFPIHFDDGPDMLAGFTLDITGRKKAELLLRKSEELLRAITNTAEDSIFCKDSNRKYTFVNRAMTHLLGFGAGHLLGKTPEELFDPESAAAIREVDDRTFSGRRVSEIRKLSISGKEHYFHTIQVPMQVENGTVLSINGIVRDVTDLVLAQQEKESLEAQLQKSRRLESLGTLAGGIAHDFNNILTVILGYTELAKSEAPADSALSEDLDKILQAGTRARDLVQQILTFSRQAQTPRVAVRPQVIIEEALKMLRPSIPPTIIIQENIAGDCGSIEVDPTQFHRVLMNICTNAIHAMEKSGGVLRIELQKATDIPKELDEIKAFPEQSFIRLSISDTGDGIDPDIIDQIFDPFFTTKEKEKGTGMGLAITYGLIKEYGGTITVDSRIGQGTIFHIYLPQSDRRTRETAGDPADVPAGGSERLLLVDDEELLAEMTAETLSRLGYRVTCAKQGDQALEIFRKCPDAFDLVVTDLVMPGLTGLELANKMLAIRPDLPVILFTGFSDAANEEMVREAGIKKLVFKPVSHPILAQLIRGVLDGTTASRGKGKT